MSSLPSRHHGARPRVSRVVPTSSSLFPNSFYGPSTAEPTESPRPADKGNGRTVPSAISPTLRAPRHTALASYQPKQSDPDNEKKTGYIPVWLDDADTLGTMRGIVRLDVASSATDVSPDTHYKSYAPANNAFAQAVAKEWREGDLVWQRTSNDARTRPAGARWSSPSPRGMEMETKEREMEMGMGINSRPTLAHARRLRYEHERQRSNCALSVDSGHTAAVFLAHPHPYSHAHPTCTHTHSHRPPPLPPSLSPFSLTPDAPRTAFAVASSTTHGRRRWGRRGRWGWARGRQLRLTARHAAANNAAASRAKLARVDSRGVADALTLRLRLASGSHIDAKPHRGAQCSPHDQL
ncbi:Trehalose-6-phosphate phosphatase [Mycena venus]|uniref:Trehalose-6-phosphate phosphatase n=1 Tax=Mycena venus TaxID=2733690 RepID=A0A8H6YNH1_9AGAR|nr:Trehalose-6-phosphate phosphatase [Mycena venus]